VSLGASWFAKPVYSEMDISSILILSSKFLGYLQQTKNFTFGCEKQTVSCSYIAGIQAIGQSHKLGPGVSNTPSATNYALKALMAMHGFCKPENTVRFCMRAPSFVSVSK
jgi:hypothetical protein